MANETTKKCGYCVSLFGEEWTKNDGLGNYVCPYCGTVNNFSDDTNQAAEEKEINEVYILLDNMQFKAASDRLRFLKDKYPDSSKVYFLSVLADNCVCYTEDSSKKGHYIPTLNDLPTSSLLESYNAKKALELAPSDLVRESYQEVFNYIEKIRLEIQEAASKKENQYDVFISTKVNLLDENGREVLDGMGHVMESPDCAFARGLFNEINERRRGTKVFFSQSSEAKAKMAGQKYENIIYSALHSARAFVLVAETRENIDWRWVRNEWMRYLRIMDNNPENHHFVLITHKLKPVDLPRELQGFQYIDYDSVSAYRQLEAFLNHALTGGKAITKLEAKTFENDVEKIEMGDVGEEIVTRKLNTRVEETSEDVKDEIELYERDLNPRSPYRREEAFKNLEELLEREPETYEAKKLLLLRGTDYYHFEDYINNIDEVLLHPEIASKYVEFATEEDAKAIISSIISYLSDDKYYFGFSKEDAKKPINVASWSKRLAVLLSSLIIPYIDSIDNMVLERLSSHLILIIHDLLDYRTPEQEEIVYSYFSLRRYLDGKEPRRYINIRKAVLASFERCYASNPDDVISVQKRIVDDILRVNPGECDTIWLDFCLRKIGKPYKIDALIKDVESGKLKLCIVFDKDSLETFETLFKYSQREERTLYTYALLTIIVHDETSYLKEKDLDSLLLSKDTDGNNELDDYELNGFDLFNKYIPYELPSFAYGSTCNEPFDETSPLLKPNESAFLKKDEPTALDKLICAFAVKMHQHGFYEHACMLYDLYLGQQDQPPKAFDCLLIRYYKELANVRIIAPEELRRVNRQLQHKSIDIDVVQLSKKLPQVNALYNKMRNAIDEQREYSLKYQPIRDLANQLPRENTIDKIPLIEDIKNKMYHEFNQVLNPEVKMELKKDFAFQIEFFEKKLPQLIEAKKQIETITIESKLREKLLVGNNFSELNIDLLKEKNKELIKTVEAYDDPSHVKLHCDEINRVTSLIINEYQNTKAAVERERNRKIAADLRAGVRQEVADKFAAFIGGFLKFLQVLLYLLPGILVIVLGIILFANMRQINIISNNGGAGWVMGWLAYSIPATIISIVFMVKRFNGTWDADDKGAIISSIVGGIVSVLAMVIGFSSASKLDPNFNPPAQMHFEVTNKSDSVYEGYSYNTYSSVISFTLTNNCSVTVSKVTGDMKLYNGSSKVGSWTVYFSGTWESGHSYRTTVNFETKDSSLYNTSFSNLRISYKITSMAFSGSYVEEDFEGELTWIK